MPRAYIQNPGEEPVHLGEESQNPVVYMVSRDACENIPLEMSSGRSDRVV